jgi:hypothetical protein
MKVKKPKNPTKQKPREKGVEGRAKRRDVAIEKNKQILLRIIELNEECKINVKEILNVLEELRALRDNFDFYLDRALMSTSVSSIITLDVRSKFLSILNTQISKLDESRESLLSRVYSQSGFLDRLSVLLEIESRRAQEWYKRQAELDNIPYDESEELWLQKLLAKTDEILEKRMSKISSK